MNAVPIFRGRCRTRDSSFAQPDLESIARAIDSKARRDSGGTWSVHCLCHDDGTASLRLSEGDGGRLLVFCHAGCAAEDVLAEIRRRGLLNGERHLIQQRNAPAARVRSTPISTPVKPPFDVLPDCVDASMGKPSAVWPYLDPVGALLFCVARYEMKPGKQFRPWTFDGANWTQRAWPAPRPLYGLQLLAARPRAPIVVVEGEKSADALQAALGDSCIVLTWSAGAKAVKKTDWSPLKGRDVTIWPDDDDPGRQAATEIVDQLGSAKVLDVNQDKPAGWDAADAVAEGWSESELATFIEERSRQHKSGTTEPNLWPASLDLKALAKLEPQPPKFIVPDWLPCGYATLFAGHGGVGKSGLALHLAVCIAAEIPFFGLEAPRRRVQYLSCEDRGNIIHWRLSRICAYLGIDLASLRGWLEVLDLVGRDCVLWERDPATALTLTRAYFELKARVEQYGTEILMLDGVSDTFGGNENSKPEVKRFVNSGLALIPPDTGAQLLIGHINKPTAAGTSTTEGYSGSTAWHNAVRARWYLFPETEQAEDEDRPQRTGNLILELQKSNFAPIDQTMSFFWDEQAKMFLSRQAVGTKLDRTIRDTEERHAILWAIHGCSEAGVPVPLAMSGPRTTLHVLRERPGFPKTLTSTRAGRVRFWRQFEHLRQSSLILEHQTRDKNRNPKTILTVSAGALETREFAHGKN